MLRWFRNREEAELDEELRAHLAIEVRRRVEAGEHPREAAYAAQRAFGNVAKIQEDTRATWRFAEAQRFLDDVRHGLRMLRKAPAWTAVICSTLALGIGLSTAIFSVTYGVLLQPLPYRDPSQLVALWPSAPKHGHPRFNVNAPLWFAWKEQSRLFEDFALTRPIANFNLTGNGPPERLQGARTSANLPNVLGVAPLFGRVFTKEEQDRDAKVAILSYGLWQRRFGSDYGILGRKIPLNGEPYEVLGVMPPAYRYPSIQFELWTPLYISPQESRESGLNYQYISVGRMKSGVSVKQAQAEISAIMHRLAAEQPAKYRTDTEDVDAIVESLAQSDAWQVRTTLYVLLSAVACVLLIGCMNLGVLLIARAGARSREMAVRAALGASGGRLARQMLAEVLPLGLVGAGGGVLLASWLLNALRPFLPATMPRVESIGLNLPVLGFAIGASVLIVFLAGLLPAHVASRNRVAGALRRDSRTVAGGGGARDALVIAQIAVTLVLLFGGTLFARSLGALLQVNPGFSTQSLLTMHFAVPRAKYPKNPQIADFYARVLARVRSLPGVTAAGIVNRLPLTGVGQTIPVEFEGKPRNFDCDSRSATPGYFEAIGIPLKQGRLFTDNDRPGSPAVGLIDERMARKVFGEENPIGKRFRVNAGTLQEPWTEIVGVVGHILNDGPEQDYRPQMYWPETQRTQDRAALVVRTAGRPESFTAVIVEQIRKEDPDQPVYDVRVMTEWLDRSLQSRNLLTGMVGLFGAASLLLACLGLYGVVSYTAGLRLREFGIRMALGASAGGVRSLVLRHAGKLALWGSAVGLALAWPVGRAIKSLLFGVASSDAVSWAIAPALLIVVALLAAFGPAAKAAKTDPAVTLRME